MYEYSCVRKIYVNELIQRQTKTLEPGPALFQLHLFEMTFSGLGRHTVMSLKLSMQKVGLNRKWNYTYSSIH